MREGWLSSIWKVSSAFSDSPLCVEELTEKPATGAVEKDAANR